MSWYDLRFFAHCVLERDKSPTFSIRSVNTNVYSVVNEIKLLIRRGSHVVDAWCNSQFRCGVGSSSTHLGFEKFCDCPAKIFLAHIQVEKSIFFVFGELSKSFNCLINQFARLISVSVKDNKLVQRKT